MGTTIRRMGDAAAVDRKFTADEAKAIVAKVKENGIVSASEKTQLRAIMKAHPTPSRPARSTPSRRCSIPPRRPRLLPALRP